jgi:hypothetical protein
MDLSLVDLVLVDLSLVDLVLVDLSLADLVLVDLSLADLVLIDLVLVDPELTLVLTEMYLAGPMVHFRIDSETWMIPWIHSYHSVQAY